MLGTFFLYRLWLFEPGNQFQADKDMGRPSLVVDKLGRLVNGKVQGKVLTKRRIQGHIEGLALGGFFEDLVQKTFL